MSDDLLDLFMRDPDAAFRSASAILSEASDPALLARAHRTVAVVLRDNGESEDAISHLRLALRLAGQSGDRALRADIRATYGTTLVVMGRSESGLRQLARSIDETTGIEQAISMYRRGMCLALLRRSREAVDELSRAVDMLRREGDVAWLARALAALADELVTCGDLRSARPLLEESRSFLDPEDSAGLLWLEANIARLNFLAGDLPAAFSAARNLELAKGVGGRQRAAMALSLAEMYLAGGLADDAAETLASVDPGDVPATDAAEIEAQLAEVALLRGEWEQATTISSRAQEKLRSLGWEWHERAAQLVEIQALRQLGSTDSLSRLAAAVADRLRFLGSEKACEAALLAGELLGGEDGGAYLDFAASFRSHPNQLVRATGWLASGRQRDLANRDGVLRSCSRGLAALDEYRETMGSSELRAAMTHRGRELAGLALRRAAHDPRTLLTWSERWRATSLAQPPVTPHGEVSPALAMLRDSGRRIAEARADGESTEGLEKERRTLERKVRAEHHQQRSDQSEKAKRFSAAGLVAEVADGAFIELVDVDGILHVLVVSKGRVRRVIAGETKAALELAEAGRFALRRAARTNRYAPGDLGQRFQDAVLGKAVRMLSEGPVTISPTAALHGAPFALMPALTNRPFSLVPSAAQWLRARAVPTPRNKRLALVSGPGLLTGGAEVASLAKAYPDATILRGADATVAATMKAIDGATLAHLATHGTFRADSPLFSALEMADGPLSVYELERLKRAPYRTILSACESGVLAPVGAQEVLGLASALFSLGSAGLVCSIAEVNDEVTADLMMQIHASLDAKRTPAEALADVRATAGPIELATAAAFVALGV